MIDIEGFKEFLYEEELAERTIETYIRGIKLYAEMFDEVNKPNLIAFKKFLIENFKPQTVNLRLTAMLNYCKYKDIPMKLKQVKLPKKTHIDNVITAEQYEKLISGLKSDGKYRWYVNIVLLAKTGMRISEALRVRKKDLIFGSVDMYTKAHMRTIYFPKSLKDELHNHSHLF